MARARRVRVYLGEDDRHGGRPAHLALLELLRDEGASGATAFRALEGFGPSGDLHVPHLVDVVSHLPLVVEWIDAPDRVERLLPRVREIARHALVTVDETEIVFPEAAPLRPIPTGLSAADAMTRDVATVEPGARLGEVVRRMAAEGRRALPVVVAGVPVGILTHGDLVARGGIELRLDLLGSLPADERASLLESLDRSERTAADVMTPDPATIASTGSLREATALMVRLRLKRLPVVDRNGRLAGMLSRVDVLRLASGAPPAADEGAAPAGLDASGPVSAVMRRDVPAVLSDAPLAEVFQAVIATRLQRALVVDEQRRVLGVVSDLELLDRLAPALRGGVFSRLVRRLPFGKAEREAVGRHADARTAADLMEEVPRARADMPVRDAIALVLRGSHKLIAVVDADGRLQGVLDRADLLRGLLAR